MANLNKINFMNQTQFEEATHDDNQLYLVNTSIVGEPDYNKAVDFSAGFVAEETLWGEAKGAVTANNTARVLINGLTAYENYSPQEQWNATSGWFIIPKGGVVTVSGNFAFLRYFPIKKGS